MLGLGWTEMLVLGVVALIFIGPKDLPVVMGRIGKVMGQIRRMGNDFQRELNRTTGLDEVRNLRNSITTPLKKSADEIRKEFNMMTPSGPQPSGAIKPSDPNQESVVESLRSQAGMSPTEKPAAAPAKASPAAAPDSVATSAKATPPAKAPAARKPRASTAKKSTPKKRTTKKPTTKTAAPKRSSPAETGAKSATKPTAKPRQPRKTPDQAVEKK